MGPRSEYITVAAATRILLVDKLSVRRYIAEGKLWARELPGTQTKLRRAEVEALAERYTRRPIPTSV